MEDQMRIIGQAGLLANEAAPAGDAQFLAEVAAEALGWQPLSGGTYLHVGAVQPGADMVIQVVGLPEAGMADMHVLLLT